MSLFDDCFDDLAITGTVRFTLDGVKVRSDKPVVLVIKHAGETNSAYYNARVKIDAQLKASTGEPTSDLMRPLLIPIFAKHVIIGWENVFDAQGKPLAYVANACEEFLSRLASGRPGDPKTARPDIVDRVFVFAMRPDNFVGQLDAEALGNG